MALNRERITLNPLEESSTNTPLELGGDRWGHGVFVQSKGSLWSPAATENPQIAQSVDTEGGAVVATQIGLRDSPVLKIVVVEPQDPATTNLVPCPQVGGVSPGGSYSLTPATVAAGQPQRAISQTLIRDLVGFDYAWFIYCPGSVTSEGLSTNSIVVPISGTPYTAGVWLRGAFGGEQVTLTLQEIGFGQTSQTLTLTANWQWFTLTRLGWSLGNAGVISVQATNVAQTNFYATGFALVQGTSLTEYFDGTFPGCTWGAQAHNSISIRPSAGGPRRDAIITDIERAVTAISKYHTGTIRRTLPNQAGTNKRVTYDLVNAQVSWDDTQMLSAGVAYGTLTFKAEPYGRGPEMTTTLDPFTGFNPNNYIIDAGASTYFYTTTVLSTTVMYAQSNLGTETRLINRTSPYWFNAGEVSAQFMAAPSGVSVMNWKGGVIIARTSAANYFEAYVTDNGVNSILKFDFIGPSGRVNQASTTLSARLLANQWYTVRCMLISKSNQDTFVIELFIGQVDPVPATQVPDYSLTVAASQNVSGVNSLCGVVVNSAVQGGAFTNLRVSPNLARERLAPALYFDLPGVPGSASGLGRMTVQDDSGNDQYRTHWGITHDQRSRLTPTLTDLFYEAEAFTPLNGATVQVAAGTSGGSVIQSRNMVNTPVGVFSTKLVSGGQQLAHIGDYEVWVRVLQALYFNQGLYLQLQWSSGDLRQWTINPAVVIPSGPPSSFVLINLGTIHVPVTTAGNQQWEGTLLAWSTATSNFVWADCMWLRPLTDGGGTAAAASTKQVADGGLTAVDMFSGGIAGNLGGQAATLGGTWTTSGAVTDFVENAPTPTATRSVNTDANVTGSSFKDGRFAVVGSTPASIAQIDFSIASLSSPGGAAEFPTFGVILYTSSTNYLMGSVTWNGTLGSTSSVVPVVVNLTLVTGGTQYPLNAYGAFVGQSLSVVAGTTYEMQLQNMGNGRCAFFWGVPGQPASITLTAFHSALAVGGTLVAPIPGIYDFYPGTASSAPVRTYTTFWAATINTDASIFAGHQLEIRSDRANRQDPSGTLWVPPSSYVGQYLKVPAPVYDDGVARMLVKASRGDLIDPNIDPIEAQVNIIPRYAQVADL